MNWIDLILLGVCGFALSLGFQKGLIKQLVTIMSILLGIVLAGNYHTALAARIELEPFVKSYGFKAVSIGAYIGIFALTVLIAQGIGHALRKSIEDKPLGQIDRALGSLLGGVKVSILCGVIALGVFDFAPAQGIRAELSRSYIAPRLARTVRDVFNDLPADYRRSINAFVQTQKALAINMEASAPPDKSPVYAQAARKEKRATRT